MEVIRFVRLPLLTNVDAGFPRMTRTPGGAGYEMEEFQIDMMMLNCRIAPDCKVAEKLCISGPYFYVIDNAFCNTNILTT